jgi:predicted dehydrogenase
MTSTLPDTIRWGIIGCGAVTERKSGPAYQQTPGFALHAVMRRDAAKAADYARRHGVPRYYDDADALIADPDIDAVYIATPPDTHLFYALKVAAANKPCCIEKPMAPTFAACEAICAAFENRGLPLFVAYYRRSLPRFAHVKRWLDQGRIGAPRHVGWQFSRTPSPLDLSRAYNWRTDTAIAAGGYFDDLASHGIDLFAHLLGEVLQASGYSINQQGLYSAGDAVSGAWLHAGGVTGGGSWNFGSFERCDKVEITGSRGKIAFSVFEEMPLQLTTAAGVEEVVVANPDHIQLHHVHNMHAHLRGSSTHPSTGRTAARTAWAMDRILGKNS